VGGDIDRVDVVKIIYVDVDDAFVRSAGTKRMPIPKVIEKVKELHKQGHELYCWSTGGKDYAREAAEEFGIDQCFVGFLPKPNIMSDDVSVEKWTFLEQVHPNELSKLEGI